MPLNISSDAAQFVIDLQQPKVFRQVWAKVLSLERNPKPADYKHLTGHPDYFRVTSGEYRIIYKIDGAVVRIVLVGKRNDDEVYRELDRMVGRR